MGVFFVDEMSAADLGEVVAIEAVSHSKVKGRASFESDLANPVARCWVLRQSGAESRGADRVVGYLVVWVTDVVEVIDIAIVPELRGQRLAERLLARALRPGPTVLLEVRASNAAAMRLYERFGFERVGLRRASELCVGGRGASELCVGGRSLRGRAILSPGGGRARAAGRGQPVGVLIPL